MSHDQLARVFPDGRTVHIPSDGNPLNGYELARADIEKRGSGEDASPISKLGLFAALFRSKSNDDEDEGASAPVVDRTAPAAPTKSAEPVPMPRAKPAAAATLQLASADAQIVPSAKARQSASSQKTEPKPQTPADIINARGFWGDALESPNQATPAQVAAISARQALASSDPQPTASISALDALAYAPPSSSPVDRSNVVAASAPIPRGFRITSAQRSPAAASTIDSVVAKGPQSQGNPVATSARLAASRGNDIWTRVMMLAPSASTSLNATVLGNTDLSLMRMHFIKPQAALLMTFSDDPQMGMLSDRFTGSATAKLATQSFVLRTAWVR
jgi:hypothetical protein